MINSKKTDHLRILGEVDISEIKKKVVALSSRVWAEQNEAKPNKFGVLDKAEHIVFRFINSFKDHRSYSDRILWEDWKEVIEPLLEVTTKMYGYNRAKYPRIMLAKLPAGESIKPHIDRSQAAQFPHKVHIPLVTNNETFFILDGEKIRMKLGTVYEVNNRKNHSVINNGIGDRIHLIFELFEVD